MKILKLNDVEWLSVTQAAQAVNMSPSKIRNAITGEKLKAFRDGKLLRIHRDDLNDYMNRGRNGEL